MNITGSYDPQEGPCRDITITYHSDEFYAELKHILGINEDQYDNIILPTKEFAGVIKKMSKQIKNQFMEYFKADITHHQPAIITLVYAPTSTGWTRTIGTVKWVGMESDANEKNDTREF